MRMVNNISSVIIIIVNLLQCRNKAKATTNISKFIHNSSFALTFENERNIYKSGILSLLLYILLLILQIGTSITVTVSSTGHYFSADDIFENIEVLAFTVFAMELGFVTNVFTLILRNLEDQLKCLLTKMASENKVPEKPIYVQPYNKYSYRNMKIYGEQESYEKLADLRKFYIGTIECLRKVNDSMNPQIAMAFVLVIILTVVNAYLLVLMALIDEADLWLTVLFSTLYCMKFLFLVIANVYVVIKLDSLLEMVVSF